MLPSSAYWEMGYTVGSKFRDKLSEIEASVKGKPLDDNAYIKGFNAGTSYKVRKNTAANPYTFKDEYNHQDWESGYTDGVKIANGQPLTYEIED